MNELFKRNREMSIAYDRLLFLERFSANIKSVNGNVTIFEIELWVECDDPDTSRLLKSRLPEVHEMVASTIQHQKYESLMREEGRNDLKDRIAEVLEKLLKKWHKDGKITRVFFSRFVAS